jgi:hypothetical protein
MTTEINLRAARQHCAKAKAALDDMRSAIKHLESGIDNPNRPNPRGEVADALAELRMYLSEIEQALELPKAAKV